MILDLRRRLIGGRYVLPLQSMQRQGCCFPFAENYFEFLYHRLGEKDRSAQSLRSCNRVAV